MRWEVEQSIKEMARRIFTLKVMHVVCAYQFDTMEDVARKFQAEEITLEAWKKFHTWLHGEEVLHKESHAAFKTRVDEVTGL